MSFKVGDMVKVKIKDSADSRVLDGRVGIIVTDHGDYVKLDIEDEHCSGVWKYELTLVDDFDPNDLCSGGKDGA